MAIFDIKDMRSTCNLLYSREGRMIVYLITNIINGKQYVGQTIQVLERRWNFHMSKNSRCLALKAAIEKYGKENFKVKEVYRALSLEELNKKEQEFIADLNTLAPNGYNLTTGGDRPVFSKESIEKMSKSAKGRSSWCKGMTVYSDPRIAYTVSKMMEGKRRIFGNSGPHTQKHSPETIEKMRSIKIGKRQSESTKEKIGKANSKPKPDGFSETMRLVQKNRAIRILCIENNTEYESISVAAKTLDLNPGHIYRMIKSNLKNVKGFTFKMV